MTYLETKINEMKRNNENLIIDKLNDGLYELYYKNNRFRWRKF